MSMLPRCALVLGLVIAAASCATAPATSPMVAGQVTIDGAIAAIDTDPWAYDGNAVVQVDTATHGRVAVNLPARWNLCEAPSVDMQALKVGMRVRAIGAMDTEGRLVVCQQATDRLVPSR